MIINNVEFTKDQLLKYLGKQRLDTLEYASKVSNIPVETLIEQDDEMLDKLESGMQSVIRLNAAREGRKVFESNDLLQAAIIAMRRTGTNTYTVTYHLHNGSLCQLHGNQLSKRSIEKLPDRRKEGGVVLRKNGDVVEFDPNYADKVLA